MFILRHSNYNDIGDNSHFKNCIWKLHSVCTEDRCLLLNLYSWLVWIFTGGDRQVNFTFTILLYRLYAIAIYFRFCLFSFFVWRRESCTYFWAGSTQSFVRTAFNGIGGHFRRCVDLKHSKLFVQCKFKHTAVHKSTGTGNNNGIVSVESVENSTPWCTLLVATNFGKWA